MSKTKKRKKTLTLLNTPEKGFSVNSTINKYNKNNKCLIGRKRTTAKRNERKEMRTF